MTERSGKCLCGAVRFTVGSAETHHHACHCGMCRRWAGGPLLGTMVEGLNLEGAENVTRYESSAWAERGFCKICGSHLFYYLKPADRYIMSVGAFDDSTDFHLASEIYVDHQPAGYAFAGLRPRLTEAETLAHFAAPED